MIGEEHNLHTFTKIGDKNYKVIVDSKSSINAISSKVIKGLGLKAVPLPHPYMVSWINSTADLNFYKDKI